MFVHMENVIKRLSDDVLEVHIISPSRLRAFKFMENDTDVFDESVIYICKSEDISRRFFIHSPLNRLNILIVGALSERPLFLQNSNYIVVNSSAKDGSLYTNRLCEIFLGFYNWELKLFSYSKNVKTIKEVCDICYEMTGISMFVMDVNHQMLAISASPSDPITYFLEKGYSYSFLKFITNGRPSIKEIDENKVVDVINPITNEMCRGYCVRTAYSDNIYLVYYKNDDGAWDKADSMLMDYFVDYFQKGILHGLISYTPYKPYVSDTLEELIINGTADIIGGDLVASRSDVWTLLILEFSELMAFRTLFHFDIIKLIKDSFPEASCALIHASIAVLLPGAKGTDEQMKNLQTIINTNEALCIRSVAFTDLSRISQIWKQLKFVIDEVAKEMRCGFCFYGDYVVKHCRSIAFQDFPKETLIHSSLLKIRQYDKENDTDYLKSVVAYLRNNCSINKTAQALFIHRNSLLYRIRKIEDILGYDISTSENRLDMLFSSFFLDV